VIARNRYEERARAAKIARFTMAFDATVRAAGQDPTAPATAKEIVRQLTDADEARWEQLAKTLGEPQPPSKTTREQLIAHYQHIANRAHQVREQLNDQRIDESNRYAIDDGPVHVEATQDSCGFSWRVTVAGEFKLSGYTRGSDVEKAFAAALTAARES
jgi:hypothetical protein